MITGRVVTIGDLGIVTTTRLKGGVEHKASPEPIQNLPSTSDIIPITSDLNMRDVAASSWAFVGKTFHTNLTPLPQINASRSGVTELIGNWNGGGRLNA